MRNGKSNHHKLTPLQLAEAVGLSRNTIYRRLDEGDVDPRLIEYAGPRKILLHPRAVRYFRALWKRRRGSHLASS